jgi:hypothetical protein
MPTDIATVFMNPQIGLETVPGTAVAALKVLQSLGIKPAVKVDVKRFAPQGYKFDTMAAIGKEWVEAPIDGLGDYNELTYLINSVMSKVAPTGGGNAKTWVSEITNSMADIIATYSIEFGNKTRASRFAYGLVTSLGLDISRDGVSVRGAMMGQALIDDVFKSTNATYTLTANASPPTAGNFTLTKNAQTTGSIAWNASAAAVQAALEALSTVGVGNVEVVRTTGATTLAEANAVYTVTFMGNLSQIAITMTGTFTGLTASGSIALAAGATGAAPTSSAQMPILGNQYSVYLADTYAGLPGTALTRAWTVNFDITNRYGMLWPLNAIYSGYAGHVERKPEVLLKLKVEADDTGMGLLTTLRAGAMKFIRVKAVGPAISGGGNYTMQIDMAGKVVEIQPFEDVDGVYSAQFGFAANYDPTWGKALEFTLINTLVSL